jgi:hypothetical protein
MKDERVREELTRFQRIHETRPRCDSEDIARAEEVGRLTLPTGVNVENEERTVRGFLAVMPGPCNTGSCITEGGEAPSRCCNSCHGWSWYVSAPRVPAGAVIVLDKETSSIPRGWVVMDCTQEALQRTVPLREVIVRGVVSSWEPPPEYQGRHASSLMRVSRICVLETPRTPVYGHEVTAPSLPGMR